MCHALGHTDPSMTKHYINLDKVELKRAFPDIVAMKEWWIRRQKRFKDDEIDIHNVSIRQGLLFMDIYSIRFVILVHK